MRCVIVRYKVKPERAAENVELVRAVYDELHERKPAGLRYATFQLDDDVSFVHVAEHADGSNPLTELPAFQRFSANVAERCDEPPVVSAVRQIGAYRFLAESSAS